MIVDTHVHVVSDDQRKYPGNDSIRISSGDANAGQAVTPGGPGGWVQDMTAEPVLSLNVQADIDKTVLVQAYSAYKYDNSYTADCAAKYLDRFISVCILDPTQSDTPDRLTYWVKQRGMRGLRLFTTTETESTWLDDPRTFSVWERAASLGIPICIMVLFHQIPRVRTVLERFPHVTVALDHLAVPRLSAGPPYDSVPPLLELVRFPNLYLKFSSVSLYEARRGKSTPKEFFTCLIDRFGARRLMWGSNFPATYDRSLRGETVDDPCSIASGPRPRRSAVLPGSGEGLRRPQTVDGAASFRRCGTAHTSGHGA
jgi:predicted TIM-barrel fold metal-dependent hydrolase